MSGEAMDFPQSWRDFVEQYSFKDSKEEYTNGSMLISTYRVEQMVEHYFTATCFNDSLKRSSGVFVCSKCEVYLDVDDMSWDGEDDSGGFYEPRFCPSCGAKAVS